MVRQGGPLWDLLLHIGLKEPFVHIHLVHMHHNGIHHTIYDLIHPFLDKSSFHRPKNVRWVSVLQLALVHFMDHKH